MKMNDKKRKNEYYIVGIRPVTFVKDDDGMDILVYDWGTKNFIRDLDYLTKAIYSDDSEEVKEEEFNKYLEKLRNEKQ